MADGRGHGDVGALVDDLFRREAGRLVAMLARIFGPAHLSLAEEVVQDALVRALGRWPYHGIPDRPGAWLATVARHRALDAVRREARLRRLEPEVTRAFERLDDAGAAPDAARFARELADDQLGLMFACCHPCLPRPAQVALTLKTLGGFGIAEIARAFLADEATIAQRITRAKRRIRDHDIAFAIPAPDEIADRRDAVLECLYLMFTEGHAATRGRDLVREGVCRESLRLTLLLAEHPVAGAPEADALAALMMFQAARFPARTDARGELKPLEAQDRGLWDARLIAEGQAALGRAMAADELSVYHLEAGIAGCHAAAPSWRETDWPAILGYYDLLLGMRPSPVVALNRAVALAMVEGPERGLAALDAIDHAGALASYHLLPATRGELCFRLGRHAEAWDHFRAALALAATEPERRHLARRIAACAAT